MKLSVIIPVYNEEGNVAELAARLDKVLSSGVKNYEIIFIDDGSSDRTFERLSEAKKKFRNIKIVKMRRNFGQTYAISTGFSMSTGDIIVVMDGDLQNDPEDIPKLLRELSKGYDVVSGWRKNRKDPAGKRLFSRISNTMARKLTGLKIHDSGCSLKAYRRAAVKNLELHGEMHRFIPALVAMEGFKVSEIPVNHNKRKSGKTKYGWGRLTKGMLDLFYIKFLSSYGNKPLHFFGRLGIYLFAAGAVITLYKILQLLLYNVSLTVGPLLLLAALLVITSAQFVVFGMLSDVQLRMYHKGVRHEGRIEKIAE